MAFFFCINLMYRFSNQTLGRWTQETLSLPWCWFRIIFVIFNVLIFFFWKACDVGKLEREGLGCKIEGFCHDLFAPSLDFTSASYIVFKNCSLVLYLDLQFFDLICSWSTCPNTVGILRVGYRNFYSQAIFHWGHHADPSTYVASRNTKKTSATCIARYAGRNHGWCRPVMHWPNLVRSPECNPSWFKKLQILEGVNDKWRFRRKRSVLRWGEIICSATCWMGFCHMNDCMECSYSIALAGSIKQHSGFPTFWSELEGQFQAFAIWKSRWGHHGPWDWELHAVRCQACQA